jgi:hypothetical protein
MLFQDIVQNAKQHFPNLQIKYKDSSLLMKILGTILFFNKSFMTDYTTTIGSTVYFPTESFVNTRPISSSMVLLHELTHLWDSKKISNILFTILYLSPQSLILLALPLLLVSWKIALLFLIFAAPIPSYFRMYFERRAYFASLYVMSKLGKKLNFDPELNKNKDYFVEQFKGPFYYFMFPFNSINKDFDAALIKINNNKRPFESLVFDILDDLIK